MQMQLILLANIILSIGAVIGSAVFASQTGDIFILSDTYRFYWFMSIFSLLVGIVGYGYHKINYVKQQFIKSEHMIYSMGLISLLFTVLWLAASISMTSVLTDCLQIKNLTYPEYITDDDQTGSIIYFYYDYNYTCNGEIITTTFGYSLFILWCVVSYIVAIKLSSRLQTMQKQDKEKLQTTQNPDIFLENSAIEKLKTTQNLASVETDQEQIQTEQEQIQTEQDQIQIEQIQTEQDDIQIQIEQIQTEQDDIQIQTEQDDIQIQIEQIQPEYQPIQLNYTNIIQV